MQMHALFSFSSWSLSSVGSYSHPLEYASEHKYIGLCVTPTRSWDAHVNKIVSSANRSLGYIQRNFCSGSTNLKRILYITLIRPKLE